MESEPLGEILKVFKEAKCNVIRRECLQGLRGFTVTDDLATLFLNQHELINLIIPCMTMETDLAYFACQILVNLSAGEINSRKFLSIDDSIPKDLVSSRNTIVTNCLQNILIEDNECADLCCMILCNISRDSLTACYVLRNIPDLENTLSQLINAFCDLNYNKKGCNLDYLGPFFSNISQSTLTTEHLCRHADRLVPFTEYEKSVIRRGGVVGMLRNMSFREDSHKWMLSPDGLNILPSLLLPLAGPEEFPEDEMDKLPIEVQYLPDTKERDPDPDIRRMLLETLLRFCSHSDGRKILREKNVYIILRELHKTEKDSGVLLACENVVDILIRTEDEIGADVLSSIEVPDDLCKKFNKMDADYLNGY